jgi:hypothetical protein
MVRCKSWVTGQDIAVTKDMYWSEGHDGGSAIVVESGLARHPLASVSYLVF